MAENHTLDLFLRRFKHNVIKLFAANHKCSSTSFLKWLYDIYFEHMAEIKSENKYIYLIKAHVMVNKYPYDELTQIDSFTKLVGKHYEASSISPNIIFAILTNHNNEVHSIHDIKAIDLNDFKSDISVAKIKKVLRESDIVRLT